MSIQNHADETDGTTGAGPKQGLKFALVFTGAMFLVELAGGLLTGSLALVADSAHMFFDTFALALSLGALVLSELPATHRRTYGWHRAEVLAALLNGLLLAGMSVEIFVHGWRRLFNPPQVMVVPMIAIAAAGLAVNILVMLRLRRAKGRDLNVRGAYLHVLGDLLSSIAVVAGGAVMFLTGRMIVDPILGICIGGIVLVGSARLVMDALHVLLEGVPPHIALSEVGTAVAAVPGVRSVHDIHVWAICSHIISMSCHVITDGSSLEDQNRIVSAVEKAMARKFCIAHTTIQVDERETPEDLMVSQDLRHGAEEDEHGH